MAEPPALTDKQILGDPDGTLDRQFTIDGLMSGRSCRDALRRSCEWHKAHGEKIDCSNTPFVREPLQ